MTILLILNINQMNIYVEQHNKWMQNILIVQKNYSTIKKIVLLKKMSYSRLDELENWWCVVGVFSRS